jgi:hypothetical protein
MNNIAEKKPFCYFTRILASIEVDIVSHYYLIIIRAVGGLLH